MRKNKPNSFDLRSGSQQNRHAFNQKKDVQNYIPFKHLDEINLFDLLKSLFSGINKLFVYFKYKFLKHSFGLFETNKMPWLKIGFVVLALFVLFKKDMQFSVNMKAPSENLTQQEIEAENGRVVRTANYQEFGLGASLPFLDIKENKTKTTKKVIRKKNIAVDIDEAEVINYVKRFSKIAKTEMSKYGIPASVKLAQGILESRANQNPKTEATHNHFGQPMAEQSYNNAWENWRAHSIFLTNSSFRRLLTFHNDVEKWAEGLETLGYSTDKDYAEKLMWIIMQYDLVHFDG